MTDHFDIICEGCGTRIGGCRCPAPDKVVRAEGYCMDCKIKGKHPGAKRAGEAPTEGKV